MKCLFFDIVATIFKVIHENESVAKNTNFEKVDLLAKVDAYESVSSVQEEICNVFRQICEITKSDSVKSDERLSDGIIEFVRTNYNDHNLNVAFISQQFGVSANYVSTLFKKETGMALSEYISNVRIEHAKRLLKDTNMKASEISSEVGFASFRTFSRVFSSMVGTSPGEYRKKKDVF
jgi:YesN/AraC family two-component response regulator